MANQPNILTKEFLLSRRRKGGKRGCWEWGRGVDKDGYGKLTSNRRSLRAHRVAAFLWLGFDLDSKELVMHRCDNPPCFNPEHLFWGTAGDNMHDAKSKGRHWVLSGEACPWAKVNEATVRAIRARYERGKVGYGTVGREFGLHRITIKQIITRQNWASVT